MPLYKEDLDKAMSCGCGHPDCANEAQYLHARCHPESKGVEVSYEKGLLYVSCSICKKPIIDVAVAHRPVFIKDTDLN